MDAVQRSLSDAQPRCFWLDDPERPRPCDPLAGPERTDLAVVGGGFTGLWAALLAKESDPNRDVVLIEADAVAEGASGRNGGFVDSSLTHGSNNGLHHFPEELETLEKLGAQNYEALLATLERHAIDARYEGTGVLNVGAAPHQAEALRRGFADYKRLHPDAEWLDREQAQAELDSPTYCAAVWRHEGCGILDPARLAWGLRRAALALGVRVYEGTPLRGLGQEGAELEIRTPAGRIRARRVVLGTNAFRSPLRRMRASVIPVWDYVLVSEPLSHEQRESIGWWNRQGVGDCGNRFHYYRLTRDDRILWGGYDAIYHFGNRLERSHEQRPASFRLLARHFFETFPQLRGLRFTHCWGGPIASTTRFTMSVGSAYDGRVAWAIGYTGMGVGATRFGARAALEQLEGEGETLALEFVRRAPIPWPPEPLRWLGVEITQRALARADRNQGRRGAWLRLLDHLGLGFDS